jgi:hypothetical protein
LEVGARRDEITTLREWEIVGIEGPFLNSKCMGQPGINILENRTQESSY